MTPEEKAKDFLSYIGRHEERLKHNLAKNVTYDRDIFENAFQDTVIRIHDAILRNNPDIRDYEHYFFTASRKWYITLSNRGREESRRHVRGERNGGETEPEPYSEPASVEEVRQLIEAQFGENVATLFLDYLSSKVRGRTSYARYGAEVGIPSADVGSVVKYVRQYLRKKYPLGLSSDRAREETGKIERKKRLIKQIRLKISNGLYREEKEEAEPERPCEG